MTNPPEFKLSPCPFCGGEASVVYQSGNEVLHQRWLVGCTLCSVQMIGTGSNSWAAKKAEDDHAKATAIRAWNRRASPSPPSEPDGEVSDGTVRDALAARYKGGWGANEEVLMREELRARLALSR